MRVDVAASLADIDPARWDRLAGHAGVYQSYAWLRTLETDPATGAKSWYVVVSGDDGVPLGALPVRLDVNETSSAYRADTLFAGLPGPWSAPTLTLGSVRGYQNRLLLDPTVTDGTRTAVVGALLDAVERIRVAEGAEAALLFYATDDAVRVLRPFVPDVEPLLTDLGTSLTLPGGSFEDYLALFPRRSAGPARELRKFGAAGYEVSLERLSDTWREIAPIRANVDRRHGRIWSEEDMTELMRGHARHLDEVGGVICCRADGRLVACSVFLDWGDTLHLRMVGFDYERLRGAFEYFNVMFYLPIRHAYECGRRRLEFGIGGHEAKVLRRARLDPLWTMWLPTGRGPDPARVRQWNSTRLAGLLAGLSRIPQHSFPSATHGGETT